MKLAQILMTRTVSLIMTRTLMTTSQLQLLSRSPLGITEIQDIMPSTLVSILTDYHIIISKRFYHPGLYQKIDPKVREARRKKFFGSGRKKRSTPDEDGGEFFDGKSSLPCLMCWLLPSIQSMPGQSSLCANIVSGDFCKDLTADISQL